jgi:hypothetical protein
MTGHPVLLTVWRLYQIASDSFMNELYGLIVLFLFAGVLFSSYQGLTLKEKLNVRMSAVKQAEGLHNLRVNLFIFCIAALVRSNWMVAAACVIGFTATFLWLPQATQVQGGTAETEWGFYLAFILVVPPRLAAISLSSGTGSNEFLVQIAVGCLVAALLVHCAPSRHAIVYKMRSVLAPWHNVACIAFLVVVTPIVGAATFGPAHVCAGAILLTVTLLRACKHSVCKQQLAFFMHWLLPLAGGRLPVALLVLGGSFSLKAGVILAISLLAWSWCIGTHRAQLDAEIFYLGDRDN